MRDQNIWDLLKRDGIGISPLGILFIVESPLIFYRLQSYINNIEFLFIWKITIDRKKLYMALFPSYNLVKELYGLVS